MTKNEEIHKRLRQILEQAKSEPSFAGAGPLVHADFDELQGLSKLVSDELPASYLQILNGSKFPTSGRTQFELAERLTRAISVQTKFGSIDAKQDFQDAGPTFVAKGNDKSRLLELSSDIRKIVLSSAFFDDPHKRRLLNRIAAIEHEIHQPAGKLDVLLAGVVDVGDALGTFGKKVEPLTKRIQEIARIGRKSSKDYDQLPAPEEVKSLPSPETASDD